MANFDEALARAEYNLRRFWHQEYSSDGEYWNQIDDGYGPRFYRKAWEYVNTILPARLELLLTTETKNPLIEIERLRDFAHEVTDYLWSGEHAFGERSRVWNILVYPEAAGSDPDFEPLRFQDLWDSVWLDETGEPTLLQILDDAIDSFWLQRAGANSSAQPKAHDSEADSRECRANRREQVEEFLRRCSDVSATRIRKRHLWLSVGHSKGRQFEYWQACDEKATAEDRRNFARVLAMAPLAFIGLLKRNKILP